MLVARSEETHHEISITVEFTKVPVLQKLLLKIIEKNASLLAAGSCDEQSNEDDTNVEE